MFLLREVKQDSCKEWRGTEAGEVEVLEEWMETNVIQKLQ